LLSRLGSLASSPQRPKTFADAALRVAASAFLFGWYH
jgi:hypothetical protein